MRIIRGIHNIKNITNSVATIGNFDGGHLGHSALISKVVNKAKELNLKSVVITFEPYPSEFFQGKDKAKRLAKFNDKALYLQQFNIDYLLVLNFNANLANITAKEFINEILVTKLQMQYLFVGDDFKFGKDRLGDYNLLKQYGDKLGYKVEKMPSLIVDGKRVSSSLIRTLLSEGRFDTASKFLGHKYSVSGKVCYGNGFGRTIGFPTANLPITKRSLPFSGIFVVTVIVLGQELTGVASLGTRPTVDGKHTILEVFIFDFNDNIYGKRIQVNFLKKLRMEIKYDTIEEMVAQIEIDANNAKQYFKEINYDPDRL